MEWAKNQNDKKKKTEGPNSPYPTSTHTVPYLFETHSDQVTEITRLGVTSKWVPNGQDRSQTATGKPVDICDSFHTKMIIISSKLLLELNRKAHLVVNKQFCLQKKFIS